MLSGAEVAQIGRALDSTTRIVEGEAEDRVVAGSNPALGTTTFRKKVSAIQVNFIDFFSIVQENNTYNVCSRYYVVLFHRKRQHILKMSNSKVANHIFYKIDLILRVCFEAGFSLKFKKSFLVSFSLLLSAILFVQLGFAQVRTAGVSQGDWFKYGFSLDWDSELDVTPEDFIFSEFLQSDWVTLTIQDVSGTNITGQLTIHYENNTEKFLTGSVDLITGEGDLKDWLISANLNANDSIYATKIDEILNETITQTYPWGSTETNHLVYSYNSSSVDDYSFLSVDLYWDQEMGILTEMAFEAELQQNGTLIDGSTSWMLTESNLENIPEFTQPTFIFIIVSVTLLISILKIKGKIKLTPSS